MSKNLINKCGIFFSSLFMTASAVYLYSPVIGSHADSSATADINVEVGEVLALTLDKAALDLSVNPNNFVSGTISASVATNSQYGYTLTLEDVDNSANMTHANTNIDTVLTSAFDGTKTSSTMEDNTWGYSLDATDFRKVPANGSPVTLKTIATPIVTEGDVTSVTFGAMVGNVPSGTYTDKVLFTAYTNGASSNCDGFFCISKMQEMTSSVCEGTTTPLASATEIDWDGSHEGDQNYIPRTTLTDTRDNKTYLVSKFADGKCWMSQSLDLVLLSSTPLTSADTDLNSKSSWTPDTDTSTNISTFVVPEFWQYEYENAPAHTAISYRPGTTYYRNGVTSSSTPSTNDGKSEWEKVGIYYDQDSAMAGSDNAIFENFDLISWDDDAGKTAPDSICPKGWRLPTAGYSSGPDDVSTFANTYSDRLTSDGPFNSILALTATGQIRDGNLYEDVTWGDFHTSVISDKYYQSAFIMTPYDQDATTKGITSMGWDSVYRHRGYQLRCVAR
jgi:hypothetical protein